MLDFGIRNLMLYFKDKSAVLLSFLAEFIILGLYVLFLRDNLIASFPRIDGADALMDVWMMAGVIGTAPVTTAIGACGIMVEDKVKKIDRDFSIWPVSRWTLLGGYMFSTTVICMLMSLLLFFLSEMYAHCCYGLWPGAGSILHIYGILMLNAVSSASLGLLLASFLETGNALAACCTIIGALMGFMTGIYLPIGSLPESVQWVVRSFPASHGVTLLRQAFLSDLIPDSFGRGHAPSADAFMEYMGVRYVVDGSYVPEGVSRLILLAAACLCITAAGFRFSRKRGRRHHQGR